MSHSVISAHAILVRSTLRRFGLAVMICVVLALILLAALSGAEPGFPMVRFEPPGTAAPVFPGRDVVIDTGQVTAFAAAAIVGRFAPVASAGGTFWSLTPMTLIAAAGVPSRVAARADVSV